MKREIFRKGAHIFSRFIVDFHFFLPPLLSLSPSFPSLTSQEFFSPPASCLMIASSSFHFLLVFVWESETNLELTWDQSTFADFPTHYC